MLNPFTPRGAIKAPEQFVGRWRELSIIFERLEALRPVLLAGAPGVGKSSLLYHITQSAAIQLDDDELRAYYLDLSLAADAAEVQRVVLQALGWAGFARNAPGDGLAALEVALIEAERPLLLALDRVDVAIAAGWGKRLLEELARLMRRSNLLLVAAIDGPVPSLSEPFSVVTVGALAAAEVRLLAEAYLGESEVRFSPPELRTLYALSAGHPAYLQRAAFHLFRAKQEPGYDWRAAYLREARLQPIAGSPLPPEAFLGKEQRANGQLRLDDGEAASDPNAPPPFELPNLAPLRPLLAPLIALLAYLVSNSLLVALVAFAVVSATLLVRRRA